MGLHFYDAHHIAQEIQWIRIILPDRPCSVVEGKRGRRFLADEIHTIGTEHRKAPVKETGAFRMNASTQNAVRVFQGTGYLVHRRHNRHDHELFALVSGKTVLYVRLAEDAGFFVGFHFFVADGEGPFALDAVHHEAERGLVGVKLLARFEAHEGDAHFRFVRKHLPGYPVWFELDQFLQVDRFHGILRGWFKS